MNPDRAELAGTGAAILFHVALIAALSMSLASVSHPPEPPSMEVELVDDFGMQSAAPETTPTPPPPSEAPELGQAPEPVKAKATYVCLSNDEDGVANAIDTILLPMLKG